MGGLIMVGLSHRQTPLDVREQVAIDEAGWRASASPTVPTVLISTCNRVEVYGWSSGRVAANLRTLRRGLARAAGVEPGLIDPYLVSRTDRDAVLHLVRVASGLDSLVVGEEQIRGQVRTALQAAETYDPLPVSLRGVVQRASESARRIRGSTRLGTVPSIAAAAINVAARGLQGGLRGQPAVVLGAGVMARAAVESLLAHGARARVLNRTPAHAERLLCQFGGQVDGGPLDQLEQALAGARLVVCATASRTPVVKLAHLEAALARRDAGLGPLVVLDIALPRDVETRAKTLRGVILYDLEDLERLCPVDAGTRHAELESAEVLAAQEADRLMSWLRHRDASPAIAELHEYAEKVRQAELRRSASRLRDLTPQQVEAVEALTAGIVKKLMHGPTVALRDTATRPGNLDRSDILRLLRSSSRRRTG
jgi:glutamyl-tRNA reductase